MEDKFAGMNLYDRLLYHEKNFREYNITSEETFQTLQDVLTYIARDINYQRFEEHKAEYWEHNDGR